MGLCSGYSSTVPTVLGEVFSRTRSCSAGRNLRLELVVVGMKARHIRGYKDRRTQPPARAAQDQYRAQSVLPPPQDLGFFLRLP